MARPYSSLVEPILDAARARAPGLMTWRDLAQDIADSGRQIDQPKALSAVAPRCLDTGSQAEMMAICQTIQNMARRGIFARSGTYVRGPAGGRPMTAWLYQGLNPTPATTADGQPALPGHEQLQNALRGWMQAGV